MQGMQRRSSPLIAHASHILQPLDLVAFAILKRKFTNTRFDKLGNPQSKKIVRMMAAFYQASAPHQNAMAFENLGLIPFMGADKLFYLRFDRGTCRKLYLVVRSADPPEAIR
jgi:hypothetical protein